MKRLKWILLILLLPFYNVKGQSPAVNDLPENLDNYIEKVMQTFEVPGINLAIVKDGKVVLTKGYGIKAMGKPDKVNEHTLFCIASNTKAFTATALSLLVEEGKIKWDNPVIDYVPWFRMSDPYITSQMTVRDLLVHHSGLAPYVGDLLQFPPSTYTRKDIVKKIRYIPMKYSFRSTYAYDNILYLAAAEVIQAVSGQSWEDFIKTRILDKIGMDETIDRFSLMKTQPNISASHARVNGKVQRLKDFFENGLGDVSDPAGGIVSNAVDMAKWMITQLDSGRAPNGVRLFHPSTTNELWSIVTPMPVRKVPENLKPAQESFNGYALGFHVSDYRSHKLVSHGGKLDGFISEVALIPSLKLGITVLTNQESGSARSAIIKYLLDYYLDAPSFDWLKGYKIQDNKRKARVDALVKKSDSKRNKTSKPSLPLEDYTGTYRDSWYGIINISKENDHLVIRFSHTPGLVGDLKHWQYNTFIARWRNREIRADAFITFSLNPDGSIREATMKAVSPLTDISFDFRDLLLKPLNDK